MPSGKFFSLLGLSIQFITPNTSNNDNSSLNTLKVSYVKEVKLLAVQGWYCMMAPMSENRTPVSLRCHPWHIP